MRGDPTYLGTVQDVRGASVSVAMDEETLAGLAFIDGSGYRIGQVGSFVRIPIGYVDLFGIVSQVGAGAVPERLAEVEPHGHRWMTVQLVGEGLRGGQFSRGLSQFPTIGDPVHLVAEADLAGLYGGPKERLGGRRVKMKATTMRSRPLGARLTQGRRLLGLRSE